MANAKARTRTPLSGNLNRGQGPELDDALRATPAQRLAWLEDASKLAWAAGAVNGDADNAEQSGEAPL
ncbi:MAG: hypothetical protein MZV65_37210 [Chromatiales bacterium]|nr:hypothetical protein [Chromatiales bacterium]